jgi:uncharacterized repeat protein (TIGR03803 family)
MPKLQSDKGGGMREPNLWQAICLVCVFCAVAAIGSPAQTFKTLVSFNGIDGDSPSAALVQGRDGNFYGVTGAGGNYSLCPDVGCGTVFKITPAGKLTTFYSFCSQANCADGSGPNGLTLATDGNWYGTTNALSQFTVFKITRAGNLTTLYYFNGNCDCLFDPSVVQATNGNFYGTTAEGGVKCGLSGCGTLFKITPAGALTTLYDFCSRYKCADGKGPEDGVVQASDGNFYGTTAGGGARNSNCSGCGTVYKITPKGKLTTLYSFCAQTNCADGSGPDAELVQATNGAFYGTTSSGGANSSACRGYGCGTVFKITPAGKLTTLYSFCTQTDCADGSEPRGLLQATDGNFYGTTSRGGLMSSSCQSSCGTVFKITPAGKLTTLYSFCTQTDCADGDVPSGLVQLPNGKLYGTTYLGGDITCNAPYGCGTIFSLSRGLRPFVETVPTSGKVGTVVTILGNNLKGTTSVAFNGTAASFNVVSNTEIKTTVPIGATTGFVAVTTPKKTLKSNVVFRVTK